MEDFKVRLETRSAREKTHFLIILLYIWYSSIKLKVLNKGGLMLLTALFPGGDTEALTCSVMDKQKVRDKEATRSAGNPAGF